MKNFLNYLIFSSVILVSTMSLSAQQNELIARQLAQRIVPQIADRFSFENIDACTDTFSVEAIDGKVAVKGSSAIAMAVGLNRYLRECLGTNVSWFSSQPVVIPGNGIIPDTPAPITGCATLPNRFFLNYCTFGYTMPFWDWQQWERFIDWMALNGINMPLAMTGQEKIWYETWRELGLPEDSIFTSFTAPPFLPWHWMANIDHYQGPLTRHWLEINENLQKKILQRERDLGMRPVLPAFSGHVPKALARVYPHARITPHKRWCAFSGDDNTWFLDPSDPLYARIQHIFVNKQDSIYGTDHIYGIDPFNEIDSPDWSEEYLRKASANIFSTLAAADPEASWLQMTWTFYNDPEHWTIPRIKAFLEGVPDDRLVLLDYYLEAQPVWKITEAYFGKPYILCYLGNFGGNTMIVGDLNDTNLKIDDFMSNGGVGGSGLGGTLEGLDVNAVMHEFVLAKAWDTNLTPEQWILTWADSRGGKENEKVRRAWKILNEKVYSSRSINGQGGLTNMRPSLTRTTLGCVHADYNYDNNDLVEALDLLLDADIQGANPAYRFDVMNVTRQAMSNKFMELRNRLTDYYNAGNVDSVKTMAANMDFLLADLDRLMATDPNFALSRWIENARAKGLDAAEKDSYEKSARTILTTWGYPGTILNDYANRHWSGLIGSFYRPRWKMFTDALITSMERGEPFDEDAVCRRLIQWEGEWIDSHEAVTDVSDENPIELARTFRDKYF